MILYKYLPPPRIDILRNHLIRFSQPGALNDPFEFRPNLLQAASDEKVRASVEQKWEKILDKELAGYGSMFEGVSVDWIREFVLSQKHLIPSLIRQIEPKLLECLAPHIDQVINDALGALSLSEVCDSTLMWAHYADSFQGFAIGFDTQSPFFNQKRSDSDEFGFLRKVVYHASRPNIELTNTSSVEWFQTKSQDWSHEKEWRIVRPLAHATKRIECSPFPICLFGFPVESVVEVIGGTRVSDDFLCELTKAAQNFPRVNVFQMKEGTTGYGTTKEPVAT